MRSTGIDRRTLLKAAPALGLAGLAIGGAGIAAWAKGGLGAARASSAPATGEGAYVAARQEADGRHVAVVFDPDSGDRAVVPLPGRGHDVAVSPRAGLLVVFARRPGRFAVAVQADRPPVVFEAPADRHFNGHGVFSPAGDLLYATENDFVGQRGVIGVYRRPGRFDREWRRIGELSSFGIGPHEVLLLADGTTLAIANGGIQTDPGVGDGRTPVGSGVQADLVLIDRRSGERRGQWRLAPGLADLSIRHLAVDRDGQVWFGCQWEGAADAKPPLLGRLARTGDLDLVETGVIPGNLGDYVGSVAADGSGALIALSSPRAGQVAVVDAASGRILAVAPLADGCGLARRPPGGEAGFIATSGTGRVEALSLSGEDVVQEPLRISSGRWDNHLRPVRV